MLYFPMYLSSELNLIICPEHFDVHKGALLRKVSKNWKEGIAKFEMLYTQGLLGNLMVKFCQRSSNLIVHPSVYYRAIFYNFAPLMT